MEPSLPTPPDPADAPDDKPAPGDKPAPALVSPRLAIVAAVVLLAAYGLAQWLSPTTVAAPPDAPLSLTLPDGARVELAGGARLSYARGYGTDHRRVHLHGEAFFEIPPGRPFVVETFNAVVTAEGARFNVRTWPQDPAPETQVTLADGALRLAPAAPSGDAVALAPGQMRRLSTGLLAPPEAVSLDDILRWRRGGFAFYDLPLGAVLHALRRRYAVHMEAPEGVLTRRRILFLDRPENVEAALAAVCRRYGLRYRPTAGGFILEEATR